MENIKMLVYATHKRECVAIKWGKKYHTVRTVPRSNRKSTDTEAKSIPVTNICMKFHFPVLVQALQ